MRKLLGVAPFLPLGRWIPQQFMHCNAVVFYHFKYLLAFSLLYNSLGTKGDQNDLDKDYVRLLSKTFQIKGHLSLARGTMTLYFPLIFFSRSLIKSLLLLNGLHNIIDGLHNIIVL